MPTFEYRATTPQGLILQDTLNGTDSGSVKQELQGQGLKIVWVKKLKADKKKKWNNNVPLIEKANLCKYLATMLSAGLSLPESVDVFAHDTTNAKLKEILSSTYTLLQQGKNLSSAFEQYPKIFDPIIIALIKAGEMSGTLNTSLEYLADFLYDEYKLRQKVKSALMYPIIILVAMLGVGMLLIFFVLPRMAPVFLSLKVSLPFYTRIVLQMGLFFSDNIIIVLPLMLASLVGLVIFMGTSIGKKVTLRIVKLIPAVRRLLNYLDLARFCRILSTLLSSGVPINQAMQIVTTSLNQTEYQKAVAPFHLELQKGVSLADLMRTYPKLFPQITVRLVAAGERTGSIEKMLKDSANYYDNEVEDILNNFANIIEPILLLMVGVAVGIMVVAIIGPIYSLVGGLEQQGG